MVEAAGGGRTRPSVVATAAIVSHSRSGVRCKATVGHLSRGSLGRTARRREEVLTGQNIESTLCLDVIRS